MEEFTYFSVVPPVTRGCFVGLSERVAALKEKQENQAILAQANGVYLCFALSLSAGESGELTNPLR
jgi:hypothetical protein